ncbi:uncharacterized protein BJX67DRAFT_343004 [Aspergillus lucknowensis]|uniref:Uncharacterized protein n=1 Tax=Aspergillus lucknowensis TaxID=176173 RepID=A0ABR4M272_9EURO
MSTALFTITQIHGALAVAINWPKRPEGSKSFTDILPEWTVSWALEASQPHGKAASSETGGWANRIPVMHSLCMHTGRLGVAVERALGRQGLFELRHRASSGSSKCHGDM